MSAAAWWWLLRRELFLRPGRQLTVLLAVAIAAAIGTLALGVARWMHREAVPQIARMFPEERLVAKAPALNVAVLRFEPFAIDEAMLARVRQLPGVARAIPQMSAAFPISASFQFTANDGFVTDVILFGVPRDLVEGDLDDSAVFAAPRAGAPVPVLVSAFFLDLYNLGLAESAGLPKLNAGAAIGREFDLLLGESTMGSGASRGKRRTVRCRIVGLTPNPQLVGLIAPIETLAEWNKEFATGKAKYAALHIDLAPGQDAQETVAALTKLGLAVESLRAQQERLLSIARGVQGATLGFAALVLVLGVCGTAATLAATIRERRPVWALHRATGLSPWRLAILIALFGIALSVAGGALAFALAAGAILLARPAVTAFGEYSSLLPMGSFQPAEEALVFALALAALLVLVPLLLFARAAVAQPVQRLLRDRAV